MRLAFGRMSARQQCSATPTPEPAAYLVGSTPANDLPRGSTFRSFAVRRWLRASGYGTQREFRGAFAVTLHLLELVFSQRSEGNEWHEAARQARRTRDLVLHSWQE
jgi:hypothetical protein